MSLVYNTPDLDFLLHIGHNFQPIGLQAFVSKRGKGNAVSSAVQLCHKSKSNGKLFLIFEQARSTFARNGECA